MAHWSGTRSRVNSFKASRKAATASSSRAVPLSRAPSAPSAVAEIHLGSGPIERSFRTRRESEAPAIDVDRFGQRGIVAEFVPLLIEFACLIEQETPLLLCVERRDECGRFGIFRGGGAIGELQIVDPRLQRQDFRLVTARVDPPRS